MPKFLELYIGAVIIWISVYIIGRVLLNYKKSVKKIKLTITILIFSAILAGLNIINFEILHGTIKIIGIYGLQCVFYKLVFKESWPKTIISALILYLCLCASEVIIALVASILLNNAHSSLEFLKNTIVINSLVSIVKLFIIKILEKKLIGLVNNSKFNNTYNIVIILIILCTIALLGFKMPVVNWNLNVEFIITMIILLSFCVIGVLIIKQNSEIQKTMSMYQQLVEYSDITNNLLEDYRLVSHEHKNQLSIIRGMINDNNKELINYVEDLLEKRNIIKYQWIGELNHLPLSGLKGLINYKIMEMEKEKLNTNISISKDLMKTKLTKLNAKQKDNLYSIMGVYLDNAIHASKESKKKEISLEIYKDKKDIIMVLANTYRNKIDLEQIDNYGYTTKGKNHGVGLHIVKKIMEEDALFTQNRNLFQDYFVQELRINLSKVK